MLSTGEGHILGTIFYRTKFRNDLRNTIPIPKIYRLNLHIRRPITKLNTVGTANFYEFKQSFTNFYEV